MNDQDYSAGPAPEPLAKAAKQAWETTREKAGEALQTGERYVRDKWCRN